MASKASTRQAFELDESIACYCTEEEIRTLPDEELDEMIYG